MAQGIRRGSGFAVALLAAAFFAVAFTSASTSLAQSAAPTADARAGRWRGELHLPAGDLVIVLELIPKEDGTWAGTIGSSVDKGRILPLEELAMTADDLSFKIELPGLPPGTKQQYAGAFSGDAIDGRLTVSPTHGRPTTYGLNFRRLTIEDDGEVAPPAGSPLAKFDVGNPLSGSWAAQSSEEDETRQLKLELGLDKAGSISGTITDTGTGETTVLRDIGFAENTVAFNFRPQGTPYLASFWGRHIVENDKIKGSLSIGGRSQQLTFARVGRAPGVTPDYYAPPPLPQKHFHRLGVAARGSVWQPLHVLRKNQRNINDITTASNGFDIGARIYLMDTFGVQMRYFRGGLGFDTNEQNLALFDPADRESQGTGISPALNADSYLGVDGYELTLMGYLGPLVLPNSRFNPYVIGVAGKTSWNLGVNGRDSEPVTIYADPLEANDWEFGGGLGTEYNINDRLGVEAEWLWSYFLMEDTAIWTDDVEQWTNTHVYRLSLGVVYWF